MKKDAEEPRGTQCLPPFCTCAKPSLSLVSYRCHVCGLDREPTENDRLSKGDLGRLIEDTMAVRLFESLKYLATDSLVSGLKTYAWGNELRPATRRQLVQMLEEYLR